MMYEYFKLNRKRQKVQRKTISLDDVIAILATGYSLKLMRVKSRPLELFELHLFDDFEDILGKALKYNYYDNNLIFTYARERGIFFYDDQPWRKILLQHREIAKKEKSEK